MERKIKAKKREKENELNRKYVNLDIPKHHSFQYEKGEEKICSQIYTRLHWPKIM